VWLLLQRCFPFNTHLSGSGHGCSYLRSSVDLVPLLRQQLQYIEVVALEFMMVMRAWLAGLECKFCLAQGFVLLPVHLTCTTVLAAFTTRDAVRCTRPAYLQMPLQVCLRVQPFCLLYHAVSSLPICSVVILCTVQCFPKSSVSQPSIASSCCIQYIFYLEELPML
jgi:hypothetical protein